MALRDLFKRKKQESNMQDSNQEGDTKFYRKKLKAEEEKYKESVAKRQLEDYQRQKRYSQRKSVRAISGALRFIQSPSTVLYGNQIPFQAKPFMSSQKNNARTTIGVSTGKRGRPFGTKDVRYAKYGGVYGYRKYIAEQRRQQRIQQINARVLTPSQQRVLEDLRMRQQVARQNPEAGIIPSTNGFVPINNVLQEADDYSNIFP